MRPMPRCLELPARPLPNNGDGHGAGAAAHGAGLYCDVAEQQLPAMASCGHASGLGDFGELDEADDGDEAELDYWPMGPHFGINQHVPELGGECEDWENFAAKGQASGSSSAAWLPYQLITSLPPEDVMTSTAHTSIAPQISGQDFEQQK